MGFFISLGSFSFSFSLEKSFSMKQFFAFSAILLFSYVAVAQPTILNDQISLRSVTELPANVVRLNFNSVDGLIYFNTVDGDIYSVEIDTGQKTKVLTSSDHGLSNEVQGFDISGDGTFYLVGNSKNNQDFTNTSSIKRGTFNEGSWTWETVAVTEPYPLSNTFFDHIMNGIVVSPDNQTLYVNSGSRTDHGEVHSVDGRYPGLRETALTAKVFKIPADTTDLVLVDDIDQLKAKGLVFAEGIRNSFSLAFDKDGNLFATENAGERDDPGEFNFLEEGNHYGFPWRVGGNDTPMQYAGYDPDQDPLVQPETNAYQQGFFYDDPNYPTPPEGVVFTEPILNSGPDGVRYRDAISGEILNAFEEDTAISSFTGHRSMLALTFDTEGALGGEFMNDGFAMAFSGGNDNGFFLRWMDDPGKDLLHMELTEAGDTYEMTTTRVALDFISPIDAELIGNKMYIAEYRNNSWLNVGADTRIWELTFPANGTNTETQDDFASNFKLNQNYPNPFNPSTNITFELSVPGFVEINVSDALGRNITSLVNRQLSARTHSIGFNGANLSSGVYFYTLKVDGKFVSTQKMVLLK